jgi:histidinol dehydrogenase
MKIRRLDSSAAGFDRALEALTRFEAAEDRKVADTVRAILAEVRARGDAAVLDYARKLDRSTAKYAADLDIPLDQARAALSRLDGEQRQALQSAHERIRAFHERQLQRSWDYREADGTRLGQRVTPLERVGIYVPGGKAAYPSSVLMNAVPAKVAGVREIVMACPNPDPLVLAAAAIAGVDRILAIGGAHAVAALAHGTDSIARVDKIVGPGNVYVAEAKRQVFGQVGIDLIAGPSEILVVSDGSTPADWIAMDLFSQAEHDEAAQALLLSPARSHLDEVEAAIRRLLPGLARRDVITASLDGRGALILTRDLDDALAIANRVAPEHLELCVRDPRAALDKVGHAGAIFLGQYSCEALGDYCAGPNHVLPTAGSARFSSPLGVYDFQKRTSVIEVSRPAADTLGRIAATLADGEGLGAHARSAQMRLGK